MLWAVTYIESVIGCNSFTFTTQYRQHLIMTSQQFLGKTERAEGLAMDVQAFPRKEYVFFSQMVILFIVIVAAIINISISNGKQEVWLILLSTGVGALLPNPKLGKGKNRRTLHSDIISTPASPL